MIHVPVPFTRMDADDPVLFAELLAVVEAQARRSAFILGSEVEAFEKEFAAYCDTTFAVGVGSGTDALALSLRALDVGPGDEVIVPANSFIATAEAVSLVGATPRLVDVDRETHLVTAELVESVIGPCTKCVVPVHLYGRTVEMAPLLALARREGLAVVEDACQAHGATYRNRRVGSFGDFGCFSFYPAKNLGAWGDGGAAVTSDPELARRVRLLRSHGESPRYRHRIKGSTSRLDAVQAAVLRVKLRHLDAWNERRRRAGSTLTSALAGTTVRTPLPPAAGLDHVFHLYVIESPARDALRDHLEAHGIASAIHYPVPIHRSPAYLELGLGSGSLPNAEALASRICSLPLFPSMTNDEVSLITKAIEEFNPLGVRAA